MVTNFDVLDEVQVTNIGIQADISDTTQELLYGHELISNKNGRQTTMSGRK